MNVAILGYGTLGRALADGLKRRSDVTSVATTTRANAAQNSSIAAGAGIVLLCVKPFQVEAVLTQIAPALAPEATLISAAASVTLKQLRAWSSGHRNTVRAMPNTPARTGEGMTVLATDDATPQAALDTARSIFSSVGRVALLEERLFDAATAISGCGPAYVYLILEALSDAGVRLGLPRETALLLASQTMLGSAKLVLEAGAHPAALKDEVTTPAGCTIDALLVLEDGKLRSTIMRAAIAAAERSARLAEPQSARES